MSKDKIEIFESDDRVKIYINDELYFDDYHYNISDFLNKINVEHEHFYYDDDSEYSNEYDEVHTNGNLDELRNFKNRIEKDEE